MLDNVLQTYYQGQLGTCVTCQTNHTNRLFINKIVYFMLGYVKKSHYDG